MSSIIATLDRALDEAGAVLMRSFGAITHVDYKRSDIDLVTAADREAEACIRAVVGGAFAGHTVLGEEEGGDRSPVSEGYRWVVDPLDGTTNFAHGVPLFAVSIAVELRGEIVAAGVFNPCLGERYLAERGAGATRNGARLAVSRVDELSRSLVVTGFPYDRRARVDHYLGLVRGFLLHSQGVLRLGSAALDLCAVASGRLEAFWEEHLAPWDTAAGWLVVEEAGGRVTDFAGGRFSPFGTQTLATNGRVHEACVALIESCERGAAS